MNVLLIGYGYMGKEYSKILSALNINHQIVTKSSGGLSKITNPDIFSHVIIATPIDTLEDILEKVILLGIQNILVEKPGGLNLDRLEQIIQTKNTCQIYVAYNRRFYESVNKIKSFQHKILSMNLNITELTNEIDKFSDIVKHKYLLSMTSHVLDLAFYLCGKPREMSIYHSGETNWHKPAIFIGNGITTNDVYFCYHGNWNSGGRWRIELCYEDFMVLLCPLEKLQILNKNTVNISEIELPTSEFKPGLYNLTRAFLFNQSDNRLVTIEEQCENIREIYNKIANYE
jgi:hypothetical protein